MANEKINYHELLATAAVLAASSGVDCRNDEITERVVTRSIKVGLALIAAAKAATV